LSVIGDNLRRIRKEKRDMGQVELSKASGVAQPTISEIETGQREPHHSTLRKLADALGVPVSAFFAEEEARPLVPKLPRTPLTNSSPEALEARLFGAKVEEGVEPVPVVTEPEARKLSDALLREQLALVGWIEAYAAATSEERFERRADHDHAQTLRNRATVYHNWVFNQWRKLYDPRRSAVPFKSARQFAVETDEAVARFLAAGQAEAEQKRIERSGDAV
jgi:transcriptional regulator with XRE-family HTH domain